MRGAGIVAVSLGFGQALAYVLYVVGARVLAPDQYSSFASLMTILLVGNVLALGLQAVGARVLARATDGAPGSRPASDGLASRILRFGGQSGSVLAGTVVVMSPLLAIALRQSGVADIVLVGLTLLPITIAGALYGIAQGREDHARLGALFVVTALGRFGGGIIGLAMTSSVDGAIVGTAVGTAAGVIVGWAALGRTHRATPQPIPGLLPQVLHSSHALLALFVATSLDVPLARFFLSGDEAGQYAVGAIVMKVAFWLPSFIVLVVFPRLAKSEATRMAIVATGAVALLGLVEVAFLWLFSGQVLALIAGPEYAPVAPWLWLFGLIGAAFSVAQFLLYSRLAVDDRRAVVTVWACAVAIFVGIAVWHSSFVQVAAVVATCAVALAAAGTWTLAGKARRMADPDEFAEVLEAS